MCARPNVSATGMCRIIMLTGHGERSRVIEAVRLGVHEFLLKPVSSTALYARLVSVLTKPRTDGQARRLLWARAAQDSAPIKPYATPTMPIAPALPGASAAPQAGSPRPRSTRPPAYDIRALIVSPVTRGAWRRRASAWRTISSPSTKAPPRRAPLCSMRRSTPVARRSRNSARSIPRPAGSSTIRKTSGRPTRRDRARSAGQGRAARPPDIAGIGITNQRETTISGTAPPGEPIHNAIVWQDRRTADACAPARRAAMSAAIARAPACCSIRISPRPRSPGCSTTSTARAPRRVRARSPSARSTAFCCGG